MLGCFREALLLDRMEGLGGQEPTSQGTNKPATTFLIPFPSLGVLPGRTLCPTLFLAAVSTSIWTVSVGILCMHQ